MSDNQAADDLVDAIKLGPQRRKIQETVDSAKKYVKDTWNNSPANKAYKKYVGGDSKPTATWYYPASEKKVQTSKKSTPKKVASGKR